MGRRGRAARGHTACSWVGKHQGRRQCSVGTRGRCGPVAGGADFGASVFPPLPNFRNESHLEQRRRRRERRHDCGRKQPLLFRRFPQERILRRQHRPHHLPVERPRLVLFAARKRRAEQRRRLVLPRMLGCRQKHRRPRGFLEGGPHREVASAHAMPCASRFGRSDTRS